MNAFMTTFDGRKYFVPITLDVGAVGMKLVFQPRVLQHLLALSDILAHRDTNAHRNHTQIDNDFHFGNFHSFYLDGRIRYEVDRKTALAATWTIGWIGDKS